jgi:preprotein translocase subunit SecD
MGLQAKGVLILAILAAAIAGLYPTWQAYRPGVDPATQKYKVNLGLDLQGGMFLNLEVESAQAVQRILDRTAAEVEDLLLEDHIDYVSIDRKPGLVEAHLGSKEKAPWDLPKFRRLLGSMDVKDLGGNAFAISLPPKDVPGIEKRAVEQALEVIRNRIDSLGVSEPSLQKQGEQNLIVQLPGLKNREAALNAIGTQAVLEFFLVDDNATTATADPARHVVKYQEARDAGPGGRVTRRDPYVLERRPVLSGESVRDAKIQIDSQYNRPYVAFSLDSLGAERFASVTTRNRGRRLAIVLDDKVQSAPVIREPITAGEGSITGQFTLQEATNLAIVLRSGALPAPLAIREERSVGASLGEDSIRRGLLSLTVGGLLVVAFMVVYYRLSGVFASLALGMNLLLIIACMAGFQATLSLPGIAGIALTLGMAVDANVLIFERVREELTAGSGPRQAVDDGFSRAFWTIFDSNLTTLFAAFALLAFGTGPIKGFAITLTIGLLASMFTAIVVTRFLFDLFYFNRRRTAAISI